MFHIEKDFMIFSRQDWDRFFLTVLLFYQLLFLFEISINSFPL